MRRFNDRLDQAATVTHILRNRSPLSSFYAPLLQRTFVGLKQDSSKPLSPLAMSVIEAHEKGHQIRFGRPLDNHAANASPVRLALDRFLRAKQRASHAWVMSSVFVAPMLWEIKLLGGIPSASLLLWFSSIARGPYLHQPHEIVERMAQLKNYFGMRSGADLFTKQHLDYAREHYCRDVLDNDMRGFFALITPRSEAQFLEAINSLGI